MNRVKIENTGYYYKISIDGLDVSKYVNKVVIDLDASRPKLALITLTIPAHLELPEEIEAKLVTERLDA